VAAFILFAAIFLYWQSFTQESLAQDNGSDQSGPYDIYADGPIGTYGVTVNGQEALPTVNGKSFDVIFYKAGLLSTFETIYYLVPLNTLDHMTERRCITAGTSPPSGCPDLHMIPGTQKVAAIYHPVAIGMELGVVTAAYLIGFGYVWRQHIKNS